MAQKHTYTTSSRTASFSHAQKDVLPQHLEKRSGQDGPFPRGAGLGHSFLCDRRLSRSAREIIRSEVVPLLKHHIDSNPEDFPLFDIPAFLDANPYGGEYYSKDDQILIRAIDAYAPDTHREDAANATSSQLPCALDPRLDLLHHHEVHSVLETVIGFNRPLHVCKLCNKKFRTKYYLDMHLDRKHSDQISSSPSQTLSESEQLSRLCPATDVCPAFGGLDYCRSVAQKLEPHYRRGGPDSNPRLGVDGLENREEQEPRPCLESAMERARLECDEMMRDCFGGGKKRNSITGSYDTQSYDVAAKVEGKMIGSADNALLHDLLAHVCHSLTCQHQLHKLAGIEDHRYRHERSIFRQFHVDWAKHSSHEIGIGGYVMLILLLMFYVIYFIIWKINHFPLSSRSSQLLRSSPNRFCAVDRRSTWHVAKRDHPKRTFTGKKKDKSY